MAALGSGVVPRQAAEALRFLAPASATRPAATNRRCTITLSTNN
jgi:hypothetical protein